MEEAKRKTITGGGRSGDARGRSRGGRTEVTRVKVGRQKEGKKEEETIKINRRGSRGEEPPVERP